jgi:hypothetical protein
VVQEHDRLVGQLRALAESWERGEGQSAGDLLQQAEQWLLVHMTTTDTALEAYLAEQGPRPA